MGFVNCMRSYGNIFTYMIDRITGYKEYILFTIADSETDKSTYEEMLWSNHISGKVVSIITISNDNYNNKFDMICIKVKKSDSNNIIELAKYLHRYYAIKKSSAYEEYEKACNSIIEIVLSNKDSIKIKEMREEVDRIIEELTKD